MREDRTMPKSLSPTAMPVADAAVVLSRLGGQKITAEMFEADITNGAPTNPDGTVNLVHYAAWLVKETSSTTGG
jgi:hypothetical protein